MREICSDGSVLRFWQLLLDSNGCEVAHRGKRPQGALFGIRRVKPAAAGTTVERMRHACGYSSPNHHGRVEHDEDTHENVQV